MSKVTFRADDDLVARLDALEVSKSEAMRQALRSYLDDAERDTSHRQSDDPPSNVNDRPFGSFDAMLTDRIDERIDHRLSALLSDHRNRKPAEATPVTVNVTLDGAGVQTDRSTEPTSETNTANTTAGTDEPKTNSANSAAEPRKTPPARSDESTECGQCGETVASEHVFCPNCGQKAVHRLFCECGDEIRSDWAFCPSCGRRTPAADVLHGG